VLVGVEICRSRWDTQSGGKKEKTAMLSYSSIRAERRPSFVWREREEKMVHSHET